MGYNIFSDLPHPNLPPIEEHLDLLSSQIDLEEKHTKCHMQRHYSYISVGR